MGVTGNTVIHTTRKRTNQTFPCRKVLITDKLSWPNGLAIDKIAGKLYWNDAKLSEIECSDLNGKNRKIVTKDVKHPYGLVVIDNYIFWTDWHTKALHRANKHDGSDKIDIITNLDGLMDVRSVKSDMEIDENSCGHNNGGCSHLCLRNPKSYTCSCPTGIKMIKDKTCDYQPSNYILFTSRSDLVRISLDTPEMWDVTLPVRNVYHAIGIDFHWHKQLIYYSDCEKNQIVSVNMKNMSDIVNIITNVSAPNGLAIDWIADNMYWSDSTNKIIEVSKINGLNRKVIINEYLEDPRSVAVFPRKGYLFWTDWGAKPKIERAYLDGSDRRVLINNDIGFPNGLVIDYKTKRLYWTDAKMDKIETCDLYGQHRIQLVHGSTSNKPSTHPFDMAQVCLIVKKFGVVAKSNCFQFGDHIYWTDWYQRQIYRADKTTGENTIIVKSNLEGSMGITVVSESRQSGWTPCAIDNGGCTHLCLYKAKNYTCECPDAPTEEHCKTGKYHRGC